jgi:predicted transcriptional regulator
MTTSPETAIHDFFRDNANHFEVLEQAADEVRARIGGSPDDMYAILKRHLRMRHGITVETSRISDMPDTLREFDDAGARIRLSEALDHPNRVFQLAHVLGLVEIPDVLDSLTLSSGIGSEAGKARCRVELSNYFAAALLLPYGEVLELAQATAYDVDRIGAAYGVSFEQVCHRLTTLQRDGARGVPFFFLRVDKAGNVTKRFNSTSFTLAEKGGSCPAWNIHDAFRAPGVILPQFVELPEGGQFFTFSRTVERPVFSRQTQDRRLVVALGCERNHAHRIGYAAQFNIDRPDLVGQIGINCYVCPRQACSQRAHQPLHVDLPISTKRRGTTRYES